MAGPSTPPPLLSGPVPRHVAVIMDGNGRWAADRGLPRYEGHREGMKAVREAVEAAVEAGVSILTLFAFSTENWQRPEEEVLALMTLLRSTPRASGRTWGAGGGGPDPGGPGPDGRPDAGGRRPDPGGHRRGGTASG
jgi:hypothetical protein